MLLDERNTTFLIFCRLIAALLFVWWYTIANFSQYLLPLAFSPLLIPASPYPYLGSNLGN